MDPVILCQLWVERRGKQGPLPCRDDTPVVQTGKHLNAAARCVDCRRPNEDGAHGLIAENRDRDGFLERLKLAAECVSSDTDVHAPDDGASPADVAGQHDGSGARAKYGEPGLDALAQGIQQTAVEQELADRRALSAGDDEAVHCRDLGHSPDLYGFDAQAAKNGRVLGEAPLKGEDADSHRLTCRGMPSASHAEWN